MKEKNIWQLKQYLFSKLKNTCRSFGKKVELNT